MVGQTMVNKSLRDFVKTECGKEIQRKNTNESDVEIQDLKTKFSNLNRTNKTLQDDLSKNIKTMKKDISEKAEVTSLQQLEEKFVLATTGMVGDRLQAAMVFAVIDLCLETPSYWAKRVSQKFSQLYHKLK